MTSYNGATITYDEIGNPLSYYNGASFTWENGRRLATATKGAYTLAFEYNDDGIRTSKTVNGVEHIYHLHGSRIVSEEWGDHLLLYIYDAEGTPIGILDIMIAIHASLSMLIAQFSRTGGNYGI